MLIFSLARNMDQAWENTIKVADLLEEIQDIVGDMKHPDGRNRWPLHLQQMFLSQSELSYAQRFELTMFLVGNGLNPDIVKEWYKLRGMVKDRVKMRHVNSIIDAMQNPQGNALRWKYYDLHNTKWTHIDGVPCLGRNCYLCQR